MSTFVERRFNTGVHVEINGPTTLPDFFFVGPGTESVFVEKKTVYKTERSSKVVKS